MHQDFGAIIYLAVPSTHLRAPSGVFAGKFTEYEIQFARVGSPNTQSVFRRYRQFHQLYRSIQALGFTDPPDVPFPSKQVLRPLSASVISHRRLYLEQWLRSVAGSLFCHTFVYEFLGLTSAQPLESHLQNAAELCITATIHRFFSEPHMKLATLESFDQHFFPQSRTVHCDFLAVFLNLLVPMLSDGHAGGRTLQVLRSLLSRTQFKGASEVARLLPTIDRDTLKKARLDAHMLERLCPDTREDACEVFTVLYEEFLPQGSGVISDLLNENREALDLFQARLARLDSADRPSSQANETQWTVHAGDSELTVKLRINGQESEVEAHIMVEADLQRVLDVILKPELRCLWDLRIKKCTVAPIEGFSEFRMDFLVDSGGVVHPFSGKVSVKRESDSHAFVFFETTDKQLRSSYEVSTRLAAPHLETLPLSTQELPRFEELESQNWSTPRFKAPVCDCGGEQCVVVIRNSGCEGVAKLFTPDLLGDENVLTETWKRFKQVAEGALQEATDGREETLNEILTRKSLRTIGGLKKKTGDTVDSLFLSNRKLGRRMFL